MAEITSKKQMYELLASGAFGNTIKQYFSLEEWHASGESERYDLWGVRTMTAAGPCRLLCPRDEVSATVTRFAGQGHRVNISVMVGPVFGHLLMADVWVGEQGLTVYGIEYPDDHANWRKDMPEKGKTFGRLDSVLVLQRHLNPSSLADLYALMEEYPGHIVELTALRRNYGTVPGRNGIVWEVRSGSGDYEKSSFKHGGSGWGAWNRDCRRRLDGD